MYCAGPHITDVDNCAKCAISCWQWLNMCNTSTKIIIIIPTSWRFITGGTVIQPRIAKISSHSSFWFLHQLKQRLAQLLRPNPTDYGNSVRCTIIYHFTPKCPNTSGIMNGKYLRMGWNGIPRPTCGSMRLTFSFLYSDTKDVQTSKQKVRKMTSKT